MKKILFLIVIAINIVFLSCSKDQKSTNEPGPLNIFGNKDAYVVLVSIDGYRFDYTEKYHPPHLSKFMKEGSSADSLIPAFPTLTFPNHYTIVTGRYTSNHGIIDNSFYDKKRKKSYSMMKGETVRDGSWYGGEPLWVVAEKSGVKSATYFWVGSEAKIDGYRPTYSVPYDGKVPNIERSQQILKWLGLSEENRPRLLTLYFSAVDSKGHRHGPESPQVEAAIMEIDEALGVLFEGVKKLDLPVNIIVVSDHGMMEVSKDKVIFLSDLMDIKKGGRVVSGGGTIRNIFTTAEDRESLYRDLKGKEKNFRIYKKEEVPHFKNLKSSRVGDLVMIADAPYYIKTKRPKDKLKLKSATHGWAPSNLEMHGIFYAQGPQIESQKKIPSFENVHIYPLILKLLGLEATKEHDGDIEVLLPIYKDSALVLKEAS